MRTCWVVKQRKEGLRVRTCWVVKQRKEGPPQSSGLCEELLQQARAGSGTAGHDCNGSGGLHLQPQHAVQALILVLEVLTTKQGSEAQV